MKGSKSRADAAPDRLSRHKRYLTLIVWVVSICLFFGVYTLLVNALVPHAASEAPAPPRSLAAPDTGAVVKIDPNIKFVAPSTIFSITVMIQDASNLGGFEFGMTYNSNVVTATAVQLGPFLGNTGRSVGELGPVIGAADVSYAAYSFGTSPGPNGDGALAIITMRALGVGTSPLHLRNVTVMTTDGVTVPTSTEDGEVRVGTSVAPTVISVAPNGGCAGQVLENVVVVGQNFQTDASVELTRTGQTLIPASWVYVQSSTRISCTLNLGKAALGRWNVKVTNTDARSGVLSNGFTVKKCTHLPVVLRNH